MYSRFQNREERPVQIPEHYSGCAFSRTTAPMEAVRRDEPSVKPRPHPIEAAKPSPPLPVKLPPPQKQSEPPPSPPPVQAVPPHAAEPVEILGKLSPFSHGIGFEELLLMGLILLLAQSGKDHDMILWLTLLLFSG